MEHRGERFTIVRRGKAIAILEPMNDGHGADVKALLHRHRPDPQWSKDLADVRSVLEIEEPLTRLFFDTTFLIDAERSAVDLDDAVGDDDEVAIAAITAAELRVGVLLSSGKKRAARIAFLEDVLAVIPVIDYDGAVAEVHAELLVHVRDMGRPRRAHDLIIAATAKAASGMVVIADDSAFADLPGVKVQTHR